MTHHRITTIALTLALAAAAAPVALGDPQPLAQGEAAIANAPTHSPASTEPCSEACSGGGYTSNVPAVPTASTGPRSEVVSGGGYGPINTPATVVRVLARGGGFDWGDAGIGAGSAFALTIISVGVVLTATNRRKRSPDRQQLSTST